MNKTLSLFCFIVGCFLLASCATWIQPPEENPQARQILDRLAQRNRSLTRFKGLANIRMAAEGQIQSGRIAFAAERPDKMRVALLNAMGTPLTSLSGDGRTIYLNSHIDHKHHRMKQTSRALERLIRIPIGIEDLQNLLVGSAPLPDHTYAAFGDAVDRDLVIELKDRWHAVVAAVQVDPAEEHITGMQAFDREGRTKYRVQWLRWKRFGAFTLPSEMIVETLSEHRIELTMDRFWPNAAIDAKMFVLDPSET